MGPSHPTHSAIATISHHHPHVMMLRLVIKLVLLLMLQMMGIPCSCSGGYNVTTAGIPRMTQRSSTEIGSAMNPVHSKPAGSQTRS